MIDKPTAKYIPVFAQKYGDTYLNKAPRCSQSMNRSLLPPALITQVTKVILAGSVAK